MGGSHQTSLRRTPARSQLSGSLHPPRSHLQPSPARSRKRPRQFRMKRLAASKPAQDHDLGCSRFHAPLLTPRAAFRSGPHPPLRLSGQPLPYSKPATVPRPARCPPTIYRFPPLRRYQPCGPHVLSGLQTRALDRDRIPQLRTTCYSGHFMTLSRDFSSSSLSIPIRDSADLCLGIATLHPQTFFCTCSLNL